MSDTGPAPDGPAPDGPAGAEPDSEPPVTLGPATIALIESLQRAAPMGHIVFDADGRYLRVNDAAVGTNGGTRAERIGRTIAEVQPLLAGPVQEAIAEVVATRRVVATRLEGSTAAAPHDRRTWRSTFYPVAGRDGTLYGIGLIFEDVTEAEHAARHVEVLGAVTAALLPATTLDEVARVALATVPALLGARHALLLLGGAGSSAERRAGTLAGRDDARPEGGGGRAGSEAGSEAGSNGGGPPVRWSPPPPVLTDLAARAAESREPLLLDPPLPLAVADHLGLAADGPCAVLHLGSDAGTPSVLVLGLAADADLGRAARRLLGAVADQCAVGRERARSLEEAAAASRLTVRLQHATARLAEATSVDEVAQVVLEEARAGLGVTGGGLGLVDPVRHSHRFVRHFGWEEAGLAGLLEDRSLDQPSLSAAALRRQTPVVITRPEDLTDYMPPERARTIRGNGLRQAWAVYPLFGASGPMGTLGLSFPTSWNFTDRERAFVFSLAGQAAVAIERVRRHEAEREVAAVLQQALLPDRLPSVVGCDLAVRYLAGAHGVQVGGDWYDAFLLEDGRLALVIGDVAGHDLAAAGAMGHLRAQLRACARYDLGPAATLAELDRLVHRLSLDHERFATLLYATWQPGAPHLDLASAGHLPPLCCRPDGAELVALTPGPPLGAALDPARYEDHRLSLPPGGATLVLFTDGLVERPTRHLGEGLDLLRTTAAPWLTANPDDLADGLLAALHPPEGWHDDVALLACRLVPSATPAAAAPEAAAPA